jgi:hypothetical protein
LTLFKENDFFPPYVYKSTRLKGVIGYEYSLKVEYGGKILTASTTIPQAPQIHSISYKKHSEISGSLIIKYKPSDTSLTYHLFQTSQKRDNFKLSPTFYPLQMNKSNMEKIVENELFKGRINNISNTENSNSHTENSNSYIDSIIGPRYYWVKDTVLVSVSSIDIQSFEVLNSTFFMLSNYDNPFAVSTPAMTNIKGGIGRWTGLGTTKVFFYISSRDSLYVR